ncbi:MAG: TM2 domain-containing protein [Firmicutes bacterium]|nr:TM2 domain-containing protein [Bacillota bacterium]
MSNLSDKQLAILEGELSRNKKSTGIAYLLWFFLGSLGVHKFYIGKTSWGIAYLLMGILGCATGGVGIILSLDEELASALGAAVFGLVLLVLLGIFLFIDLFTIPRQIRKQEERFKEKLLLELEKQNYLA